MRFIWLMSRYVSLRGYRLNRAIPSLSQNITTAPSALYSLPVMDTYSVLQMAGSSEIMVQGLKVGALALVVPSWPAIFAQTCCLCGDPHCLASPVSATLNKQVYHQPAVHTCFYQDVTVCHTCLILPAVHLREKQGTDQVVKMKNLKDVLAPAQEPCSQ